MPPPQGTPNPLEGPGDYTTTSMVHNDTYEAIDPTMADFSGKTIFLNGASRAGASELMLSARSNLSTVAQEVKDAALKAGRQQPQVLTLKVEASSSESVNQAAREIGLRFGKLDALINVAGIMGSLAKVGDSDPDDWWQTMAVNVRGPYPMSHACLPLLLKGETKTLVNISSVGGLVTGAYQVSKTTVIRLTDFIAAEYADQGLTATNVHLGNILTDIVGGEHGMDDSLKAVFTEMPQLCADTLVYLTKVRRQWLNGRYINCTWDMPELTLEEMKKKIVDGDLLKLTLKTN